jgi:hypothetical protein
MNTKVNYRAALVTDATMNLQYRFKMKQNENMNIDDNYSSQFMASNAFSTGYGQKNPMFKRVQQSINASAGSTKTPILITKPS